MTPRRSRSSSTSRRRSTSATGRQSSSNDTTPLAARTPSKSSNKSLSTNSKSPERRRSSRIRALPRRSRQSSPSKSRDNESFLKSWFPQNFLDWILRTTHGPFLRPHPAFWRIMLLLSVVYELILLDMLRKTPDEARQFLRHIDSSLGRPLPEKSYGANCDLTWQNLWAGCDEFVIAHIFGWFAKALLLRDQWFCWILSVMFEIMEYSLAFLLPNFNECWWDHWILDVFTCNWLGIHFGIKTCKYLEMKQYSWRGPVAKTSYAKRAAAIFTPQTWTKFDWRPTQSFRNFIGVLCLLALFLIAELNAFFLKYLLWLPPPHLLNVARLFLIGVTAAAAIRQFYAFTVEGPKSNKKQRFGPHALVSLTNILTESLICVKYGWNEFKGRKAPPAVVYFWIAFTAGLAIFTFWTFVCHHANRQRVVKQK